MPDQTWDITEVLDNLVVGATGATTVQTIRNFALGCQAGATGGGIGPVLTVGATGATGPASTVPGATGATGPSASLSSAVILAPATSARNVIQPTAADVIPQTVKGAAAQSANLHEWQNSNGDPLAWVSSSGGMSCGQLDSRATTGTPPLVVVSTTQVNSLNVELLGGKTLAQIMTDVDAAIATALSSGGYINTASLSASLAGIGGVPSFAGPATSFVVTNGLLTSIS